MTSPEISISDPYWRTNQRARKRRYWKCFTDPIVKIQSKSRVNNEKETKQIQCMGSHKKKYWDKEDYSGFVIFSEDFFLQSWKVARP